MSRLGHALTGPYRLAARIRRSRSDWPSLPAPSLSVGNLAFGGRCKTPLVAALARLAANSGRRVAILTRGYPVASRSNAPCLLRACGDAGQAPWLQPIALNVEVPTAAFLLAPRVGDEAPWLAAVTGVPVAVHPDRGCGARLVLSQEPIIDLLLLDDGFQSPVRADLDLVVVDPTVDLTGRSALRESPEALANVRVLHLGRDLRRKAGPCRDLETGRAIAPPGALHVLAAGVGAPESVHAAATRVGLTIRSRVRLRDHHGPSPRTLSGLTHRLLVTEKDAVGWAASSGRPGTVLGMSLDGVEAIWSEIEPVLDTLG